MLHIIMSFKSGIKQKMYLIEITVELSSEATKLIVLELQNQVVRKSHQALLFLYELKKSADKCTIKLLCGFAWPEILPWASFLHNRARDRPADKNVVLDTESRFDWLTYTTI